MSLGVLVVVVGLWLLWLAALMAVLHGLGATPPGARPGRRSDGVR